MKQKQADESLMSHHTHQALFSHRQTETILSQPESFSIKVSPNYIMIKVPSQTLFLCQNKSKLIAFEPDMWFD